MLSELLRDNPLGDPFCRRVPVYVPPGWRPGARVPAVLCLSGFTGSGLGYLNSSAWQETLPERMDRLIAAGAPPLVISLLILGHLEPGMMGQA